MPKPDQGRNIDGAERKEIAGSERRCTGIKCQALTEEAQVDSFVG